jgi:hypothetical protein
MFGETDIGSITVLEQPRTAADWGDYDPSRPLKDYNVEPSIAKLRFCHFFRNFKCDNVFIYREMLMRNWNRRELYIEVDLSHLNEYDEVLFYNLQVKSSVFLFSVLSSLFSCRISQTQRFHFLKQLRSSH